MDEDPTAGLVALSIAALDDGQGVSIESLHDAIEDATWEDVPALDADAAGLPAGADSTDDGTDRRSIDAPDDEIEAAVERLLDRDFLTDGELYALTDDGETAVDRFRQAIGDGTVTPGELAVPFLSVVAEHLDDETLVPIYRALGRAYSDLGALQPARDAIERAREHADAASGTEEYVAATADLARLYDFAGEFESARDYYEQAYYSATEAGLDAAAAEALTDLGTNYYESGTDLDEARMSLEDALDAFESVDDPAGVCEVRRLLATVCYDAGELDAAREHAERALDLADRIDDEADAALERGLARSALGRVCTDAEEYDAAIDHFEAALDALDGRQAVRTRLYLVDALVAADRIDAATEALAPAEQFLDDDGTQVVRPLVVLRQGRVARAQGDHERAKELVQEAIDLGQDLDFPRPVVFGHYLRGFLQRDEDHEIFSREYFGRAKDGGEEFGVWDISRKAAAELDEQ